MLTLPGRHVSEVPAPSDLLLDAVLNSVGEGVWIGDAAGQTLRVNPYMAHLLCVEYDQLAAGSLVVFVEPPTRPQLRVCLRDQASGNVTHSKITVISADGRTTLLHVRTRSRHDSTGKYLGPILTAARTRSYLSHRGIQDFLKADGIPGVESLSAHECQILSYLAQGDRVPAIASYLDISQITTRTHLSTAFRILGVSSQQQFSTLLRGRHTPSDHALDETPQPT